MRRVSVFEVVKAVITNKVRVLEVAEPLAIVLWPQLLLIHSSLAVTNFFRLTQTNVVSYAIENYPTDKKLMEFTGLPRWISRSIVKGIVRFLMATTSRIVYGTQDALDVYEDLAPRAVRKRTALTSLVWALPAPHGACPGPPEVETLVFLGTFEDRKGINRLMSTWPLVLKQLPRGKLTLLGKLGNLAGVREFSANHLSVTLVEDPARSQIFDVLADSKALILFSQPARGWKEQVGLPIVEALSMGCEIISSDQTGIQSWLSDHGHEVLPWDESDENLAAAITRALTSPRSKAEVLDDLPSEDGRSLADARLFRE
ncbi:glycosyltransferase [Cryobacterium sp. TMT4-31]|uniref:glycosyltransferase n=1 Tax=Cryobacterium sp. TMT4-31 TaxID=1259259 RepID=UPI00106D9851|nr:glycosyltransferase [Cryobacterium sp. TMT4-31]TFC89877.1 glycosyltransferase family 1 protein [Cryobacterium sp. TMT4-31]